MHEYKSYEILISKYLLVLMLQAYKSLILLATNRNPLK